MYQEFLDSAVSQFPEEYQRRTRLYQYKDPADLVNMLPKNQFGFVFCWNFMNYASFDTIKEYLKAVKVLLRPGGTFMFSYNDGDRPGGAGMAENFFMTYTPKRMLVPLAESLGYIVTEQCDRDRTVSWVELRNPGELKTVKAHQVLGEINRINN
jgi:SAM-dependent methyltransferase